MAQVGFHRFEPKSEQSKGIQGVFTVLKTYVELRWLRDWEFHYPEHKELDPDTRKLYDKMIRVDHAGFSLWANVYDIWVLFY